MKPLGLSLLCAHLLKRNAHAPDEVVSADRSANGRDFAGGNSLREDQNSAASTVASLVHVDLNSDGKSDLATPPGAATPGLGKQ
jgi:hypothetical protein